MSTSESPLALDPEPSEADIQLLPVESIHVLNSRARDRKKYREIVTSIADVGLKKPITVCPRPHGGYWLVCGEGRLQACRQLGQTLVPAIVKQLSVEEAHLASLVENIARRRPTTMETVRELALLRDRGYSATEIATKTGLDDGSVTECLHLYDHGEERLLESVAMGRITLTTAMLIARSDQDVQQALLEANESGQIGAKDMSRARQIAGSRTLFGKVRARVKNAPLTSEAIVRAFQRERQKQRQALKKAQLCESRLLFVINAMRMLLRDDYFVTLLRAEGLESLPEFLASKIGEADERRSG